MASFSIYFEDLNEKAQKEFLKSSNIESAEEGNYDLTPIAIIEVGE